MNPDPRRYVRGGRTVNDYDQRRDDAVNMRLLGAPAASVAAWLSAIGKAERASDPCPSWADLERLAPSLPIDRSVFSPEPSDD
jgi:hypothetical protein